MAEVATRVTADRETDRGRIDGVVTDKEVLRAVVVAVVDVRIPKCLSTLYREMVNVLPNAFVDDSIRFDGTVDPVDEYGCRV